MYIVLVEHFASEKSIGKMGPAVGEALRAAYGKRHTATYLVDFNEAPRMMATGALAVGSHWSFSQEDVDHDLVVTLREWAARTKGENVWLEVVQRQLQPVLDQWGAGGYPFFMIVVGANSSNEVCAFSPAFRVNLISEECADVADMFPGSDSIVDMTLVVQDPAKAAEEIIEAIQEKSMSVFKKEIPKDEEPKAEAREAEKEESTTT